MSKTIKAELSTESIQNAIDELTMYSRWLTTGNGMLVDKLGELGEEYVEENSKGTESDPGTVTHHSGRYFKDEAAMCNVVWEGSEITFIEFGAGVYFNGNPGGSPHPRGEALGMLIAKYGHDPEDKMDKGYSQGIKDAWVRPDGTWTNGTPALMPMWRAINSEDGISKMVFDVAKGVLDG